MLDRRCAIHYSLSSRVTRGGYVVTTASAAGKAILLGEHAVVYGRPAIAVPLSDVRVTVHVNPLPQGQVPQGTGITICAADLGQRFGLQEPCDAEAAPALRATIGNTLAHLGVPIEEAHFELVIRSSIPIARGLGSGTAVATAIVRALAAHYGRSLPVAEVSQLAYRTEILLHGTPSGLDNTVVAYEEPVYFIRGQPPAALRFAAPVHLLIADTGIPSRTRDTVARVRQRWLADRTCYEGIFDEIGAAVEAARRAIEGPLAGAGLPLLGQLMSHNHSLLQRLGVSCAELDRLVDAALSAGALGAKLSGGGGGGCMVALLGPLGGEGPTADTVRGALSAAGAPLVLETIVRVVT